MSARTMFVPRESRRHSTAVMIRGIMSKRDQPFLAGSRTIDMKVMPVRRNGRSASAS
jgi:hypothetical protein